MRATLGSAASNASPLPLLTSAPGLAYSTLLGALTRLGRPRAREAPTSLNQSRHRRPSKPGPACALRGGVYAGPKGSTHRGVDVDFAADRPGQAGQHQLLGRCPIHIAKRQLGLFHPATEVDGPVRPGHRALGGLVPHDDEVSDPQPSILLRLQMQRHRLREDDLAPTDIDPHPGTHLNMPVPHGNLQPGDRAVAVDTIVEIPRRLVVLLLDRHVCGGQHQPVEEIHTTRGVGHG